MTTTDPTQPLDLDAIRAAWLRACGTCDAGYPTACTCPPADPRTVIDALVAEIDRLRTEAAMLRAEREDALQEAESIGRDLHFRVREVDRLRSQLATITQERDQAVEALVRAEAERDEAREAYRRLAEAAQPRRRLLSRVYPQWIARRKRMR